MPTNAELTARLDEVTRERDDLRARVDAGGVVAPVTNYTPTRPFLSEGERQDLAQYGVTNSPFTGERLTATGEGVEPATATARANDERAQAADVDGRERADVIGLDRIPVTGVARTGAPATPADDDE